MTSTILFTAFVILLLVQYRIVVQCARANLEKLGITSLSVRGYIGCYVIATANIFIESYLLLKILACSGILLIWGDVQQIKHNFSQVYDHTWRNKYKQALRIL